MTTKFFSLLAFSFFLIVANPSFAQTTRLEIQVQNESRVSSLIGLKQLISQQHRNIFLEDLEIESVIVEAKSRDGMGIVSLIVGNFEGASRRVPANPDFRSPYENTYFSLEMAAPSQVMTNQNFQLKTQGNIKISRVLIYVSTKQQRFPIPGRITYQSIAKFRLDKFIETTKTIRINTLVRSIRLKAHSNSAQVIEVRAQLADGREIFLDGLNENIRRDSSRTINLDTRRGVRITSLFIRAVSPSIIGSRADLEVQTGY